MKKTLAISLIFAVLSICGCSDNDKKPNQNAAGPANSGKNINTLEDYCDENAKDDYDAKQLKKEYGVIDTKMVEQIQSELAKDCLDEYEHYPYCKEEITSYNICYANITEALYLETIQPLELKCENEATPCKRDCEEIGSEKDRDECLSKCEEDEYACVIKDHPCSEQINKYEACDAQHHNDILSYEQSRKSKYTIIYDTILTNLCTTHAASFDAKYLKDEYDVTDPAIVEKIQKAIYPVCYDYLDKFPNCRIDLIKLELCESALTDAQQDDVKALKVKCEDDVYLPCNNECQKLDSEEETAACVDKCNDDETACIDKSHPCSEHIKEYNECSKQYQSEITQYEASQKDYEDIIMEIINASN